MLAFFVKSQHDRSSRRRVSGVGPAIFQIVSRCARARAIPLNLAAANGSPTSLQQRHLPLPLLPSSPPPARARRRRVVTWRTA